jgi:hypothetical protein
MQRLDVRMAITGINVNIHTKVQWDWNSGIRCSSGEISGATVHAINQRFSNFFQVGTTFISQNVLRTTFISQNVLRTTLLLSPLKANLSFF